MATKQKKTTTTTKTTGKTKPPKITLASVNDHVASLQVAVNNIRSELIQVYIARVSAETDTYDTLRELRAEISAAKGWIYFLSPLAGVGFVAVLQLLTK